MEIRTDVEWIGTWLALVSAQTAYFKIGRSTMKKQRKQKADATITLRLWTPAGAMKIVPYLRSLGQSLRDAWLELRQARLTAERAAARPGKPDRASLIQAEESERALHQAEARLEEVVQEMLPLSAFGVDPARGLIVLPWLANGTLAWFVFDLFEPQGIVAWRLHSDPIEMRRPLTEIPEPLPQAG